MSGDICRKKDKILYSNKDKRLYAKIYVKSDKAINSTNAERDCQDIYNRQRKGACYKEVEKNLKIPVYFAYPYAAWQRGSNENSNELLREYYLKRTALAKIDENKLGKICYN